MVPTRSVVKYAPVANPAGTEVLPWSTMRGGGGAGMVVVGTEVGPLPLPPHAAISNSPGTAIHLAICAPPGINLSSRHEEGGEGRRGSRPRHPGRGLGDDLRVRPLRPAREPDHGPAGPGI